MTTQALRLSRGNALRFPTEVPSDARTIIYRRVSTDDQAKDDLASFPEQERQCRAYAADLHRVVDHLWDDDGVSGRDESRLERLAAWCEGHRRADGDRGLIIALKRDRWARFVHDANASAYFEYRMRRAGWDVAFALERKTGNKTADAITASLHTSMASAESEEKARRASVGMLAQARVGHWQGRAPFGYALAVDGKHRKLVDGDPGDVATVRRIFARFTAGATLQAIAAELNATKVPGPFDQHPSHTWRFESRRPPCGRWTSSAVRSILGNPTYTGRVVYKPRHMNDERNQPVTFARIVRESSPSSRWQYRLRRSSTGK